MKLGLNIKIDVSKIDKARLFKGGKGTYLDLVAFIDTDQKSQFGDNGPLSQAVTKEERDNKVKLPYLGNITVFWEGQSQQQQGYQNQGQQGGYQQSQNQSQGYQPPPQQGYQQPQQNYQPAPQPQEQNQNNQPYPKDDIPF